MSAIKVIAIAEIDPPELDVRSIENEDNLRELAQSISEVGILNPLIVKHKGARYELVAGFRRIRAAQMAGLSKVPCQITDDDPVKGDAIKLIENLQREDMNPVDEGRSFQRLIRERGLSVEELAKKISKSPAYISQRMTLVSKDLKVMEAVFRGKISFTLAREILAADSEADRHRYLAQAMEFGATPDAVKTWRRNDEKDRSYLPPDEQPEDAAIPPKDPKPVMYPCQWCDTPARIETTQVLRVCTPCQDELFNLKAEMRRRQRGEQQ